MPRLLPRWTSTDTEGHRGTQTDIDGHRGTPRDIEGHRRTPTDTDGHRRTSTDIDGHRRTPTVTDGHRRHCLLHPTLPLPPSHSATQPEATTHLNIQNAMMVVIIPYSMRGAVAAIPPPCPQGAHILLRCVFLPLLFLLLLLVLIHLLLLPGPWGSTPCTSE